MPAYVSLRHVRFDDAGLLGKTITAIMDTREYDGVRVDGLDGTAFAPGEYYLTLAQWVEVSTPLDHRGRRATTPAARSTTARSSSARPTC